MPHQRRQSLVPAGTAKGPTAGLRESRNATRAWGPETMKRGGHQLLYAGSLAQPAHNGGLTWFHLQFLLGFRRLGWDVLFVDRLEPAMCLDESGAPAPLGRSVNLKYFLRVMDEFGLADSFSLIYNRGEQVVGLPLDEVRRRTTDAALLLNVMGFLDD